MTTQTFEFLTDAELQAAPGGGWMGNVGNFFGGMQTGFAAQAMGVDLGNQGAGPFAIGAMIGEGKKR